MRGCLFVVILVIMFSCIASYNDYSNKSSSEPQQQHPIISESQDACHWAIKDKLARPSTFSLKMFDQSHHEHDNGRITWNIGFSAENSLGQEKDYRARCLYGPTLGTEVTLQRQ